MTSAMILTQIQSRNMSKEELIQNYWYQWKHHQ